MITLIAAMDRNGAIGKNGTIPWEAPEDLSFFNRETRGGALIMGRRTWDSLPVKPLPGRVNIVVTSTPLAAEYTAGSIDAALELAANLGHVRVYGIGGSRIYRDLLPMADRLLLTRVDLDIDDADTFFPEFSMADWRQRGELTLRQDKPGCTLQELLRR